MEGWLPAILWEGFEKLSFLTKKMLKGKSLLLSKQLHMAPCVTCLCAPLADEGNRSTGGGHSPACDHW